MGVEAKTQETKTEPIWKVLTSMLKNKDLILLFFSYFINMIGSTNPRTGYQIFVSKMYGFYDVNQTKSFTNTVNVFTMGFILCFSIFAG